MFPHFINRLKIRFYKIYRNLIFNLPFNYKPNFIIVGAQKAGTTTLFNLLNQHPEIKGALIKEVNYFNNELNYAKGNNWYLKNFKSIFWPSPRKLYFEATPEYILERVFLQRIYAFDSNIKIVIILRNPIYRAFSAWNFYSKFKNYRSFLPSFKECVLDEMNVVNNGARETKISELRFLRRGFYVDQVRNCYEIFGRENVLVIFSDDLRKEPISLLNKVILFLGLQVHSWDFLKFENRNVGSYRETLDSNLIDALKLFYNLKNRELELLLGEKTNWR